MIPVTFSQSWINCKAGDAAEVLLVPRYSDEALLAPRGSPTETTRKESHSTLIINVESHVLYRYE